MNLSRVAPGALDGAGRRAYFSRLSVVYVGDRLVDPVVIEKIRKLYALARRPGTEAEGILAAEFLASFCRKHNVDPRVFFGKDWVHNLARRTATRLRVEKETKIHQGQTWTEEIEHIFGPCLVCAVEIQYGVRGYRWGREWIEEQFEPANRLRLVESLESGRFKRAPKFRALTAVLCEVCREKFGAIQKQYLDELEAKRQLKEERRNRARQAEMREEARRTEWRLPDTGEFDEVEGTAIFYAVCRRIKYKILFRWRNSNKCKCRGDNPGAAVGMWVNGKLVAHYYGWDISAEGDNRFNSDYQDRFGTGFEFWFTRAFQDQLLSSKPDLAWSVLDKQLLDDGDLWSEWLTHLTWHDGQRYAKVGPLPTILEASKYAAKHLRMRLLRSDGQPAVPGD